jgi:hypothetical protein
MGPTTRSKLAKAASTQRTNDQEQDVLHAASTTKVEHVTTKTLRRSKRNVAEINLIDHEIPNRRSTPKEGKAAEVREPLEADKNNVQNDSQADMCSPTEITSPSRTFSVNSNSLRSSSLSTIHSFLLEEDDVQYTPIEAAMLQERQTWHTEREQLQASIHATREELNNQTTDLLKKVSGLTADNERLYRYLAEAQKQLNALSEEMNQTKIKCQSDSNALREVLETEVPKGARLKCQLDSQAFQFHSLEAKLQSEYKNLQIHFRQFQSEFAEKLGLCVQQEVDKMRTAMGTDEMERVCQLMAENAEVVRQLAKATESSRHSQNGPSSRDECHSESNQRMAIPDFIDGPDIDGRNDCQTTAPVHREPSNLGKKYLQASQATNGNLRGRSSRQKWSQKTDHGFRQSRYLGQETPEAQPSGESKVTTLTPLYTFVNVDFDSSVDPESQVRFLDEPSGMEVSQHKQPKDSYTCITRSVAAKGKDANRTAQYPKKPLDKDDRLQRLAISMCSGSDLLAEDGQKDVAVEESSDEAMDISP